MPSDRGRMPTPGRSRPPAPLLLSLALAACTGAASPPPSRSTDRATTPDAAASPTPVPPAPARLDAAPAPAEPAGAPPEVDASAEAPAAPPCSHVPGVCCVALQPLGEVPQEQVDVVSQGLQEFYGVDVRVLEAVDLPQTAWYEPRSRWRAEKLLDFLRARLPEGCQKIAGMTTDDISTTKGEFEDWGILGLADLPGEASVFSYFRCRRRVHEVPALERLRRVAIHEVGHTLGLGHCPTYGCFLEDAGGKAETIDRETFLCDVCRQRLGWTE